MSNLKKLQDENLNINKKKAVFSNEYANISEFKNVSLG